MADIYKKEDLKTILKIVHASLDDLEEWSVYNDDKELDQIINVREYLNDIEKNLENDR